MRYTLFIDADDPLDSYVSVIDSHVPRIGDGVELRNHPPINGLYVVKNVLHKVDALANPDKSNICVGIELIEGV